MKPTPAQLAASAAALIGVAGLTVGIARTRPALLGAIIPGVTAAQVCDHGYAQKVRKTTQSQKDEVLRLAGIKPADRALYEVDHIVPLSSGGIDAVANLQAQPWDGPDGAHAKDLVEGFCYREVCAGRMTLVEAQAIFRTPGGWQAALKRFGLDRAKGARDIDGPEYDEEGFPR